MEALAPALVAASGWLSALMVVIARLSFIVFLMPGLGEQVVPVRVRALVLVAMAILVLQAGSVAVPAVSQVSGLIGLLVGELAVGFILGIGLRVVIWVLSMAGTLIAQSIGLAQFLGIALEHEAQALTANLLSMAGATLLLSLDYHVGVVVSLLDLYGQVPVGGLGEIDPAFAIRGLISGFTVAVLLAWPFVAVNLLYNICLGFINKALPQMMVAFVGAPFMVGAGVMLLAVSVVGLLVAWSQQVPRLIGWM